jgi:hypothetical protein
MPSVEDFFEHTDSLTSGKSALQILRETRQLLSVKERWTKSARARDQFGNVVRPEDPRAVAWCLEGAVARVCNPFGITPASIMRLLDRTIRIIYYTEEDVTATVYNELMPYGSILYLLDEAIFLEEWRAAGQR